MSPDGHEQLNLEAGAAVELDDEHDRRQWRRDLRPGFVTFEGRRAHYAEHELATVYAIIEKLEAGKLAGDTALNEVRWIHGLKAEFGGHFDPPT